MAQRAPRESEWDMADTEQREELKGASRLIDSIEDAERSTLESVRTFVNTVDRAFPDISDDGPRQKIIDSAFKMVEQLVGASNQLAQNMVKVTGDALSDVQNEDTPTKK
jgi:hypothetical protein